MSDVAVLLATYNGEKYITELLVSLFRQDVDFKLYVHDDGSKDATSAIVNAFKDKYSDRVILLEGPATGSAKANFLWMLGQVEADYYFLCDQDDVWHPKKMRKSLDALSRLSSPRLVFSDMYVVDQELNEISDSFIRYIGREPSRYRYTQTLIDNPAAGCTMCFDKVMREIVVSASKKVELINIPMHDAFILVLADIFGTISVLDEPLVYYRQTGENTMGAKTETKTDKLVRNVDILKNGSFFERKKAFVLESRLFAQEILKVEALPAKAKEILANFSSIETKSKLERIRFYKENDFTRAHNNIWMRFFI